jgi:hypothetical protein
MSGRVEGAWGKREIPPSNPRRLRRGVTEKKGPAGKHAFPRATEPEAGEAAA